MCRKRDSLLLTRCGGPLPAIGERRSISVCTVDRHLRRAKPIAGERGAARRALVDADAKVERLVSAIVAGRSRTCGALWRISKPLSLCAHRSIGSCRCRTHMVTAPP
jgi:hypothetical protein